MSIDPKTLAKDITLWAIRAIGAVFAYFALTFIGDIREGMKNMGANVNEIREHNIRMEVKMEDTIKDVERHTREIERLKARPR